MSNFLENLDRSLLLAINGFHFPILDQIMWIISNKFAWLPLAFLIGVLSFKRFDKKIFFWFMGTSILVVVCANLLSVVLFKETIQRYRPSHNLEIQHLLHYYIHKKEAYRGGQYGFVSSHATNFFALATIGTLCLNKFFSWLKFVLFGCAIVVCYSRMYLGVHYPSDILCGAALGSAFAFFSFKLFLKKKLNLYFSQ